MIETLADRLAQGWSEGGVLALTPDERPRSLDEAEAIQDAMIARLGLVAAAWKLGASNTASQAALGLPRPFSGLLPAGRLLADGAAANMSGWRHRGVECELAVPLLQDIVPGERGALSEAEALSLLGPLHPAFEIPDTRFRTLATTEGPLALVADNGASGWAVIGQPSGVAIDAIPADLTVRLSSNDTLLATGTLAALISSPLELVTDHLNRMLARGYALRRGEFVLLGSLTPYQPITEDGVIRAEFGAAGTVTLRASGTGDAPPP